MGQRLRSIDALRGVAALAVVCRHSGDWFRFGSIGVDLFFVISGFVISQAAGRASPSQFLFDRAWRIFPIYWILIVPWLAFFDPRPFGYVVVDLYIFPRWWISYFEFSWGQMWTLAYELAFYLLVSIAIRLRNPFLPLTLFAGALVARSLTANPLIVFFGSPIAIEFLFGIVLAKAPRSSKAGICTLAVGSSWLLAFPNPGLENLLLAQSYAPAALRVVLWGVPVALIAYGCLTNEHRFSGPFARLVAGLGTASYSIYLIHMAIESHVPVSVPAKIALSIAAGGAIWYFLERPLLRLNPLRYRHSRDAQAKSVETLPAEVLISTSK